MDEFLYQVQIFTCMEGIIKLYEEGIVYSRENRLLHLDAVDLIFLYHLFLGHDLQHFSFS